MANSQKPTIEEALRAAKAAYKARQYAEAERLCRTTLQNAFVVEALHLLGNVCVDTDRAGHGVDLIRRATFEDPARTDYAASLEEAESVLDSLGGREKVMYAFYDLQLSPVTFDVATFLVLAGSHCLEKGCNELVVVFVPGSNEGFRPDPPHMDLRYSADGKRWRLRHVLEASSWLLPHCRGTMVCRKRAEAKALYASAGRAHVFPETYHPMYPVAEYLIGNLVHRHRKGFAFPSLAPTPHALKRVETWLGAHAGGRRAVTLTLRETAYVRERNSNLAAWVKFAQWLDADRFVPVFLRDEETVMEQVPAELGEFLAFNEGIWNVDLRAALYEKAYMNLLVSNGPAVLSFYNHNARTLVFKPETPAWYSTSREFYRGNQWEPGTDLPSIDSRRHRWIWKEDEFDVLVEAFRAACAEPD